MFKIVKAIKYQPILSKIVGFHFVSTNYARMMQSFIIALFMVHLVACLWFLTARWNDFGQHTWVYRQNLLDSPLIAQWASSVYWALQTLVTVGYGDYAARTSEELLLALVWMAIGVNFYSFLVGSISSHLSNQNQSNLHFKLRQLDDFRSHSSIEQPLWFAIHTFLVNNYAELYGRKDEQLLLDELPQCLRDGVLGHQFGRVVFQLGLTGVVADAVFVLQVLQKADRYNWGRHEVIYQQGDLAESFYLIEEGSVCLFSRAGAPFQEYTSGSTLGESDALLTETRDSKAMA
jgi:hypothetical protein